MSERQRVALSQVLRQIADRDHGGNVSAMADAFGLNQSQLNQLVKPNPKSKKGAGVKVLTVLRECTGLSIDTLLGHELTGDHVVRDAEVRRSRTPEQVADLEFAADLDRAEEAAPSATQEPAPPPRSRSRTKRPEA